MELYLKTVGLKTTVYDENKTCLFHLKERMINNNSIEIIDLKNHTKQYVNKDQETITVMNEQHDCLARASFTYENQNHIQSVIKPPMAIKTYIHTFKKSYTIQQDPKNILTIYNQTNQPIAIIQNMITYHKVIKIYDSTLPLSTYIYLYCIGYYMIHDDDINVI